MTNNQIANSIEFNFTFPTPFLVILTGPPEQTAQAFREDEPSYLSSRIGLTLLPFFVNSQYHKKLDHGFKCKRCEARSNRGS